MNRDTGPSPYAAVARGRVAVPGGLLSVVAPIEGTVESIGVQPGDHVHAGQVLVQLDDALARANRDTAAAQLLQAQAQEKGLTLQVKAARALASRETAAAKAGAGAGQTADDANAHVAQLGEERAAAHASVAVARARLAKARYLLGRHALRAPFDAYVVNVQIQKGANVSPTSGALFVLLPDKPHIVRAELSSTFVNAIQPGMRASIVIEDDPGSGNYPAHVIRVGRVFTPSSLDENPTGRATTRIVDCTLGFDKPNGLRIGRRVLVRFLAGAAPTRK